MTAFTHPIYHYSRHTQWGGAVGDADFILFGPDYSSAAFVLSLAAAPGSAPLKTITAAAAGAEGISATFENPFIHPVTGETGTATIVRPQINEASFEALAWGSDPAAPLVLYYDLLMTPTGAPQRGVCHGTFTLYPGVGD